MATQNVGASPRKYIRSRRQRLSSKGSRGTPCAAPTSMG
jgi:hypothetical protein